MMIEGFGGGLKEVNEKLRDKMKDSNLHIFQKRVKRNIDNLIHFKRYLFSCRGDEAFLYLDWHKSLLGELEESASLIRIYNSLGVKELINVKEICINENLTNSRLEEVSLNLDKIYREMEDVNAYLENYLRPNLSETEKGKIDLLRKDLDNLNTEEKIRKNLEIALMEAESIHELACGIIAARVIVERLEKIDGKNDEERLANLVNLKTIDNTQSSRFSSKAFLDAARAGRNAISHKNSWFPNGAESLSLLSYAFRMTEWVSRYIKTKNETTNTN